MITCDMIARTVAQASGYTMRELSSHRRTDGVVRIRRLGWMLARDLTPHSYPQIGRMMFRRDHTTVLYNVREGQDQLQLDASFSDQYQSLRDRVLLSAAMESGSSIEETMLTLLARKHAALMTVAQRAAEAGLAFETALTGPREAAARGDLMRALKALRNHLNKDLNS